jgi:hypothetical protein
MPHGGPTELLSDPAIRTRSTYYGAADTRIGLATAGRADALGYLSACAPG